MIPNNLQKRINCKGLIEIDKKPSWKYLSSSSVFSQFLFLSEISSPWSSRLSENRQENYPLSLCQSGLLFKQCPKKYLSLSSPKTHLSVLTPSVTSLITQKEKNSPSVFFSPLLKSTLESSLSWPSSQRHALPLSVLIFSFPSVTSLSSRISLTDSEKHSSSSCQRRSSINGFQIPMQRVPFWLASQTTIMILSWLLRCWHVADPGSSTW